MRYKLARALLAASIAGGAGAAVAAGATAGATTNTFVGSSWTYTYTWPGFSPGTSTWTFDATHVGKTSTWAGPLAWYRNGSAIKVIFKNDKALKYHCHAVYVGTITKTTMSGTMSTNGTTGCLGGTGTWTATKVPGTAPVANHGSGTHANGSR